GDPPAQDQFTSPLKTIPPERYLSLDTAEKNDRSHIRVIVPYPRTSLGGVERLTCSVVRELANLVELVVWVLPDNLLHLARTVPQSEHLRIESFTWPPSWQAQIDGIAARWLAKRADRPDSELAQLTAFENNQATQCVRTLRLQFRLEHLIRKHQI